MRGSVEISFQTVYTQSKGANKQKPIGHLSADHRVDLFLHPKNGNTQLFNWWPKFA